jgi:rSAM/selenodomain-associated transferase 1
MKPVRIVIFAKAPLAGFAKTRLIPALGSQGAADLAQRLLAHTLHEALTSQAGSVELCVTPSATHPDWQNMPLPAAIHLTDQGDGDLGARMARATERVIAAGEAVLLIGTDCPQLDAGRLQEAAQALQCSDAALAPAFDGGYVLLGLTRFDSSVFAGIAWSTDSVRDDTLLRLKQLDWGVKILPTLHDIDEPSDLKWLPQALIRAPA